MNRNAFGRRAAALVLAIALVPAARIAPAAAAGRTAEQTLQVFAAASLAQAFADIARRFESAHPGVGVRLNLAGSQQLAAQVEQGAPADVIATADEHWIEELAAHHGLDGPAAVFAHNRLVVITPRTNPARIQRLQDLARSGIKLVIGAETVPVGHYSRDLLQKLAQCDGFDASFARRALANVVSEEENVKSVVAKVQLGEADAGICYRSDALGPASHFLREWTIPDSVNVVATYPIAVVAGARHAGLAREFVALVLSREGQHVLQDRGLIPGSIPAAPGPRR